MKLSDIDNAISEAERFLARAHRYREASKTSDGSGKVHKTYPFLPAESGALRRASLDLTRSLAEMRKP